VSTRHPASTLRGVLLRRILWLVAGLLALAVVAAAVVPRDDDEKKPATTTAAVKEHTTIKADVGASPARVRTIEARTGDHLELTVESDRIDTVEIAGLGEVVAVDATPPAMIDAFLDRAGNFPIKMQDTGKTVAVLDVRPAE
jgi:hypothetical protein